MNYIVKRNVTEIAEQSWKSLIEKGFTNMLNCGNIGSLEIFICNSHEKYYREKGETPKLIDIADDILTFNSQVTEDMFDELSDMSETLCQAESLEDLALQIYEGSIKYGMSGGTAIEVVYETLTKYHKSFYDADGDLQGSAQNKICCYKDWR